MTRLSQLTLRNFLIATHDVLATAFALVASFFLRFEGELLADRLSLPWRIVPWFLVFSIVVYYVFNFTTGKWRFISLPDALNILRAAAVLALVVLDYVIILVGPSFHGNVFYGRITIILYFFLQLFAFSAVRFGYRYSRMRDHTRVRDLAPTLMIGRATDAEIVLHGTENGAIKRLWPIRALSTSPADRGQQIRDVPALGRIDDIDAAIADLKAREKLAVIRFDRESL